VVGRAIGLLYAAPTKCPQSKRDSTPMVNRAHHCHADELAAYAIAHSTLPPLRAAAARAALYSCAEGEPHGTVLQADGVAEESQVDSSIVRAD
jgi:ribulose-5-phosphate 4-epimerase/fuculose-1-phosphate aldolase